MVKMKLITYLLTKKFVNDVENRAHVVAKIEEENRANNIEMDRFQVNDELEKENARICSV